jgi:hypothetical protein
LVAKYGRFILHHVDWSGFRIPSSSSKWWKDIWGLELAVESHNWWGEAVKRVVGNGRSTYFWESRWLGDAPLAKVFPRLFSLSLNKDGLVDSFYKRDGNNWSWSFSWRRELFQWERDLVVRLKENLEAVRLSLEDDKWRWIPDSEESFSVKSSYSHLAAIFQSEAELEGEEVVVFDEIWDSPAPSKVIAFSWQLLYDRLPTTSNLEYRGIISPDTCRDCVNCVGRVESAVHLFLHCPKALVVWYEVFRWLSVVIVMPNSIASLFRMTRGAANNKKTRQGLLMVWHVTIWSIWKARNNTIFASGVSSPSDIIEAIKVLSWKWSLARLKVKPCLFYEWCWVPGDCFLR